MLDTSFNNVEKIMSFFLYFLVDMLKYNHNKDIMLPEY